MRNVGRALFGFVAAVLVTTSAARGGSGRFDYASGTWDLVVSLDWEASAVEVAEVELRFTQASELLYDLTDGAMRFGRITIFDGGVGKEFADADITLGPGEAQSPLPGAGIFGAAFDLFTNNDIYPGSGPEDDTWQTIVHEFGHYALYLADEYVGVGNSPECVTPQLDAQGVPQPTSACIMDDFKDAPYGGVSELCDSVNHDPDFDTEQEESFEQSCWERVDQLFPTVSAPLVVVDPPPAGFVAPVFEYFDDPRVRVALVLDTSGSMNLAGGLNPGDSRIEDLEAHARQFIDLMGHGDVELGIVTFASAATQVQAATLLAGPAEVTASKANLPNTASGNTSIGRGLIAGRDLLIASPAPGPLVMILVTDGFHNYPVGNAALEPLAVLPSVVAANIRVHTLALGDSTNDGELREIADASGAMYWKANNTKMMEPTLTMIASVVRGGSILAVARQHSLGPGAIHVAEEWAQRKGPADIQSLLAEVGVPAAGLDPTLQELLAPIWVEDGSQEVAFNLAWSFAGASLNLVVKSPGGDLIGPTAVRSGAIPGLSFVQDRRHISYVIKAAESGWWSPAIVADPRVGVTNYTFQPTVLNRKVTGYADGELSVDQANNPAIRIVGAARDGLPVTGASVTATVTDPGGVTTEVEMFDDGDADHGDEVAADGLYSAIVSGLRGSGNGTYTSNVVFDIDPSAPSPPSVVPGEEPQTRTPNSALYSVQKFRRSFPIAVHVDSLPAAPGDQDRDGILDERERGGDADEDGVPNDEDPDADGDDLSDLDEGADDLDCDGVPNFLDRDADGDGIDDGKDPVPLELTSCELEAATRRTWFTLYSHRNRGARFVAISEEGEALFVEAGGRNLETTSVDRVARGRLDAATLDDLAVANRTLRELGSDAIAAMQPDEPIEERGLLADVSTAEDGVSTWFGLALRAMPPGVAEALERAAAAASSLAPQRPVSLLQATAVSAERADRIQTDPRRFYSFVPVDESLVRSLPAIATALRDTGRLVELGPRESSVVREWQARSNPRAVGNSLFIAVERERSPGFFQLHLQDVDGR